MKKIYNNILEIKDNFDIFLFDAYGVFWSGSEFYEGSLNAMEELVKSGKILYILSNSTKISKKTEDDYEKKGLIKGKHFHKIITAGEFTRYQLLNNKIKFSNNSNPVKYYIFDKSNCDLFLNTNYIKVETIEEADFIYFSSVSINDEEYNNLSKKYLKYLFKDSFTDKWRITKIDVFMDKINVLLKSGKPILNSNPDYRVILGTGENCEPMSVIVNGSIMKYLKEQGAEVLEYGKPYKDIYDFVFDILSEENIKINKDRICMVGDTLRTDIKGANNANIKSVLCVETGITSDEINTGKNLVDMEKEDGVETDFIIKRVGNK